MSLQPLHKIFVCSLLAIALLAFNIPRRVFSASKALAIYPQQLSIGIIGAGLAGLTAGYRLHQQGHQVKIYEARNRVGGRVYTWREDDGSYEELGGTSIQEGGMITENIRRLIAEFRLKTIIKTGLIAPWMFNEAKEIRNIRSIFEGLPQPSKELKDALAAICTTAEDLEKPLQFLAGGRPDVAYLIRSVLSSSDGRLENMPARNYHTLYNTYKTIYTAALSDNPPFTLEYINGGNDLLPQCLAQIIGAKNVLLNTPITHVTRAEDGRVTLTDGNGTITTHDKVICTVPCSTLASITFDDSIVPTTHHHRLEKLKAWHYAIITKMLFRVETAKADDATNPPLQTASMPYFYALMPEGELWSNVNGSILTYYITRPGSTDLSTISLDNIANDPITKAYGRQIQERFPFLTKVTPIAAVDWQHEEYSRGTWAYAPGSTLAEHDFLLEQHAKEDVYTLHAPINQQLYFAGEHTSLTQPGNMEGAVESGERIARMILNEVSDS